MWFLLSYLHLALREFRLGRKWCNLCMVLQWLEKDLQTTAIKLLLRMRIQSGKNKQVEQENDKQAAKQNQTTSI